MATDPKTVIFCSDLYTATVASGVTTALTMPDIYLPESSKVFKAVAVHVFFSDIVTAGGSSQSNRSIAVGLGGGAKTTVTNTNPATTSGEHVDGYFVQDLTSRFVSDWTGTSMTCEVDFAVTLTGGTSTGVTNVCVMVEILYDYDDTSATQVKTVLRQLTTPNGALGTSKPAALETIPALDTLLPEASKVYRGTWVLVGGSRGNTSTDALINVELSSGGVAPTALFENALLTGSHYTVLLKPAWNKTVAQDFRIWSNVATFNHPICWAIITYEFDASAANDVFHSVMLPFDSVSPMPVGATALQQVETEFWVAEEGPITEKRYGLVVFWQQAASTTNNTRIRADGSSFTSHIDAAGVMAGSNAAQVIAATTAAVDRGRCTLRAEIYLNGALLAGGNLCGFWVVNYVAPKMPGGHGAHTKTRTRLMAPTGTAAATSDFMSSAVRVLEIPQVAYFISHVGFWLRFVPVNGAGIAGFSFSLERLSSEGFLGWDRAYVDIGIPDAEMGTFHMLSTMPDFFYRWTDDFPSGRRNITNLRRFRWTNASQATGTMQTGFFSAQALVTYHAHTWTVNAVVKGSAGGTVTVSLHREATGEKVLETTRSGDGAVSLTWFDNTEQVFLIARDGSNAYRRFVSAPFYADPGVTHTLRLFNPPGKIVDAAVVARKVAP